MLRRIGAIILLIMFAALLVNIFVFQYALEAAMTIYLIVMIAGVIMIVKGSLNSHTVENAENKEDKDSDTGYGADQCSINAGDQTNQCGSTNAGDEAEKRENDIGNS